MEFNIKVNKNAWDFYKNGRSFLEAAWRCYGKEGENGDYIIIEDGQLYQLAAPTVVNAAFACEMFFKAMLVFNNIKYPKKHNLKVLYDELPKNCKKLIYQFCGDRNDENVILRFLSEHDNDFADIRYFIEHIGWQGMNPMLMITFAYNMSEITRYLLQKESERIDE